jgi:DNA-directed RNA polymerase II subunit RPB1
MAIKTAKTKCRLVKALEDVMVCYDGTVRKSLGDLNQFLYGEGGMDGAYIEWQKHLLSTTENSNTTTLLM